MGYETILHAELAAAIRALMLQGGGAPTRSTPSCASAPRTRPVIHGALVPIQGNRSGQRWAPCSTVMI